MKTIKLTDPEQRVWEASHSRSLSWCARHWGYSPWELVEHYNSAAQKVTHALAAEVKRVDEPHELLTFIEAEAFKYRGASRARWIEQAKRLAVSEHDFALALSRATLKLYDINGPNVEPPEARNEDGKGEFFHD